MLSDLTDLQSSEESVWSIDLSFDIETRSEENDELVNRKYTFSYAEEWDKWTFKEYREERTPDEERMMERDWKRSRHVVWQDSDVPTVEVPPEVADALAEATGADDVTIQVPTGAINEVEYEDVRQATGTDE